MGAADDTTRRTGRRPKESALKGKPKDVEKKEG
jgi:hypothetical protein